MCWVFQRLECFYKKTEKYILVRQSRIEMKSHLTMGGCADIPITQSGMGNDVKGPTIFSRGYGLVFKRTCGCLEGFNVIRLFLENIGSRSRHERS